MLGFSYAFIGYRYDFLICRWPQTDEIFAAFFTGKGKVANLKLCYLISV